MTANGRFQKTKQAAAPERGVARGKQARQELLKRIRKQRALIAKRLAAIVE